VSRTKVALDFNISQRMVGALDALYGHLGFEFMHLEKLVAGNTSDPVWADKYKRFGGRMSYREIAGSPTSLTRR
jgi:hypothetical protein